MKNSKIFIGILFFATLFIMSCSDAAFDITEESSTFENEIQVERMSLDEPTMHF